MKRVEAGGGSGRRTRLLRVALLAAAWSMSGVWNLGHAIDHALHHEAGHEAIESDAAPALSAVAADTHGHGHPEILPVLLNAKGTQSFALPATTIVPHAPRSASLLAWITRAAPARAAPGTGGPSGPRAPPIA